MKIPGITAFMAKFSGRMNGNVMINGTAYQGHNISIVSGDGNQIVVDGVVFAVVNTPIADICVNGNVETMDIGSTNNMSVYGDVGGVRCTNGDIRVTGGVGGNIKVTSGDVKCGPVTGNINVVSGDVSIRR